MKATCSSIAWLTRLSNAARVAVRIRSAAAPLLSGKPFERAIEMDVARMDEMKRFHGESSFHQTQRADCCGS
jgi:hypothetical protein